jgi:anti-sigma regulatory factor (Ser/Thr protein kinase)
VDALLNGWLTDLSPDPPPKLRPGKPGSAPIPVIDTASISLARQTARAEATEIGLDPTDVERVVIAASELATNQLRHGRHGHFAVRVVSRGDVPGIEIVAADLGPGIADPRAALAGPGPSERSLGAGLSGARRLVDEMDLDVRWGQGTLVRARSFAAKLPRRREIGILGRPWPEERVSGDHAVFLRDGDVLLCAVIDGIGHGPLAADAAAQAAATMLARRRASPASILEACNLAVAGTRGAVMAVARIDEPLGTLEHAAVGNVGVRLDGYDGPRSLAGSASSLGQRGKWYRIATETVSLAGDEALLVFTDGFTSRATLADAPDLRREHPIVVAQYLMATFARSTDDALVLVAR